jgi:hypothetical protein
MECVSVDFCETNQAMISLKYDVENLKKMFSKLDKVVFNYLNPIMINEDIYFLEKNALNKEHIKAIEMTMFPVLSKYGYELKKTKFRGKDIIKLLEI